MHFDRRLLFGAQRDLRLDHGLAYRGDRFSIPPQVELHVAGDVVDGDRDEQVVDVIAAEVRVSVRRDDLEYALMQLEDGDVERAATQVIDGNGPVILLVEAVGERGGRRLIDQPQHF